MDFWKSGHCYNDPFQVLMGIKRILFVLICFLQAVIASYNIAERRGELNFQTGEAEAMYVMC